MAGSRFSASEKGVTPFERGVSRAAFRLRRMSSASGRFVDFPTPVATPTPPEFMPPPEAAWPGTPPSPDLSPEEIADNERAIELSVKQASWQWPLSFFLAIDVGAPKGAGEAGERLHLAYQRVGDAVQDSWYLHEHFLIVPILGWPQPTWPRDVPLEAGDVIVFGATQASGSPGGAGHSLIATGTGDEVSHMWWNRPGQLETWRNQQLSPVLGDTHDSTMPPALPDGTPGWWGSGYMVTRESLAIHAERWNLDIAPTGAGKMQNFTGKAAFLYKLRPRSRRYSDFTYFQPLQDVFFTTDSSDLDQDALDVVARNAEWLNANPTVKVLLQGHCDDTGPEDYNIELGERRAQAVLDGLSAMGVDPERLSTVTYGESAPFVPASWVPSGQREIARELNRRVHFRAVP